MHTVPQLVDPTTLVRVLSAALAASVAVTVLLVAVDEVAERLRRRRAVRRHQPSVT